MHAYNSRIQESEAGGWWVLGCLGYLGRPWLRKTKLGLGSWLWGYSIYCASMELEWQAHYPLSKCEDRMRSHCLHKSYSHRCAWQPSPHPSLWDAKPDNLWRKLASWLDRELSSVRELAAVHKEECNWRRHQKPTSGLHMHMHVHMNTRRHTQATYMHIPKPQTKPTSPI